MHALGGLVGPGIGRTNDGLRAGGKAEHDPSVNRRDESDRIAVPNALSWHADVNPFAAAGAARMLVRSEPVFPHPGGADDHPSSHSMGLTGALDFHFRSDRFSAIVENFGDSGV